MQDVDEEGGLWSISAVYNSLNTHVQHQSTIEHKIMPEVASSSIPQILLQ